jgi:hypothetical protein
MIVQSVPGNVDEEDVELPCREPVAGKKEPSVDIQGSTGPRSPEGKVRSKYNSTKHGILSQAVVLKSESRSEYESLLAGLLDDFKSEGTFEEFLVEKLATVAWRYRRIITLEVADIESPDLGFTLPDSGTLPLSRLDHLVRYETSLERAFDRTLSQLERRQQMRLGQPTLPAIKVDMSSL